MKSIIVFIVCLYQVSITSQDSSKINLIDDRYALIIGISTYENSKNNLDYADNDAEDFYDALLTNGKFNDDNIKKLIDENATRENIRKSIEGWLQRNAKKNDLVVIFFSGHGTQIPDNDGDEEDSIDECLVPYDFDGSDYSSIITDDIFSYWIKNLQSEKVLIIFDNCFSGGVAKQKGVSIPGLKGDIGKGDFTKDIKREIPRDGVVLLAACQPDQVSIETDEFENGIFTHYLIESISKNNDYDFNNIIDLEEVFKYLKDNTINYSKKHYNRIQEPIMINSLPKFLDLFYLQSYNEKNPLKKQIDDYLLKASIQTIPSEKVKILEEAYTLMPDDLSVQYDLSEAYIQTTNFEKALFLLEKIHTILEKGNLIEYKSSAAMISRIYLLMQNYTKAEQWALKAINDHSDQYNFYINLANIQLLKEDTLAAIKSLNNSLEINKYQDDAYKQLFYLYLFQDSLNSAYVIIKKYNNNIPNNFENIYWLGMFEKYYIKSTLGDSILSLFQTNSNITKYKYDLLTEGIDTVKSGRVYINIKDQLNIREKAYDAFPYYDEFIKELIRFVIEAKITGDIGRLKQDYLFLSKLNPDNDFIYKYIKI